jgi:hypothetical protein
MMRAACNTNRFAWMAKLFGPPHLHQFAAGDNGQLPSCSQEVAGFCKPPGQPSLQTRTSERHWPRRSKLSLQSQVQHNPAPGRMSACIPNARNIQRLEYFRPAATLQSMIEVKHSTGDDWVVSVRGSVITHHRVRVTKAELDRLSEGRSLEDLLQESFRFLLEREPNTSILTLFELPVIGRYFPEYEREIRARLRRGG